MSRYILIRRLRGPVFLLLVGVNALLNQAGILSWHQSWPFYLILWGVFALAERAAIASEGYLPYPGAPTQGTPYPGSPYPGSPYPGSPYPGTPYPGGPVQPAPPATAIVPTDHGFDKGPQGGQQ
jgi:hypothetical protein